MDYPGIVAKQFKNQALDDVSVVFDSLWPHRTSSTVTKDVPAPGSAKWPAGQTLREGAKGNAVVAMQQGLHNSGIYGCRGVTVDGVFGDQTLTAVQNFQSYTHIAVDGIAGSDTRAHMVSLALLNSAGQANP